MNSMQRQFGKLTHRGGDDDAKVSVLLQDYEEADKMLTKVLSYQNTSIGFYSNYNRSLALRKHGEMPGCRYSRYNSV
jgi:hypothetical protein